MPESAILQEHLTVRVVGHRGNDAHLVSSSLQLLGESVQADLSSPHLWREMLRENEEPFGHGTSVTIARVNDA